MPVLPAFAPQGRRSCKNRGVSLQKSFLRMDPGIGITDRDRETEHISVQKLCSADALSVHLDGAYPSFCWDHMHQLKEKMTAA